MGLRDDFEPSCCKPRKPRDLTKVEANKINTWLDDLVLENTTNDRQVPGTNQYKFNASELKQFAIAAARIYSEFSLEIRQEMGEIIDD